MAAPEHPYDATPFLPERRTLTALREASRGCRGCPLWLRGTQTVFGEGLVRAWLMLVGEQPGDREDLAGYPFVGPAGAILVRGLAEAGIERRDGLCHQRGQVFQVDREGKAAHPPEAQRARDRGVHAVARGRARSGEASGAGRPGSNRGAGAPGARFRVTRQRGTWVASALAPHVTDTVHPSSIIRAPTDEGRRREMARFVDDLRVVAAVLDGDGKR